MVQLIYNWKAGFKRRCKNHPLCKNFIINSNRIYCSECIINKKNKKKVENDQCIKDQID